MSFILDALRRSENERNRHEGPELRAAIATPETPKRNIWLPIVAVLAGVNFSLLAVLWITGDRSEDAAAPVSTQAAAVAPDYRPTPIPPPAYPASTGQPPTNQLMATAPGGRDLMAELEEPALPAPLPLPATRNVTQAPAPLAAPSETQPGTATVMPNLPSLTELLMDGSLNIKPLNLELHVYSQNANERFVFINTSRYREGDRLAEGPTVEQISDAGVILSYQGRDFLLTRE